ncbi:MAG: efflux RND transporter periplasmic adaptor subunit [Sediminibacterium sp.]
MANRIIQQSLLFSSVLVMAACGGTKTPEPPKAPPPAAVTVYAVQKEAAVYFDNYPATITPLNQVDLKAQVTGYITGMYFTDGQHVRRGQKLYEIDRQQYQANYDQAVANLNVVKASLAKAQQDADRYNDLLKQDAIAKQKVDYALADLQSVKAQVIAAQANVSRLSNDLRFSTIYAPFDGTIGISQAKVGTLVTANQNILNTVSSDNPMAVDVSVDQKEIPRFIQLQLHNVAADSTFTLTLPDNTIYTGTGHISLIDRAVDPQTGTIKTRLVFVNNGQLKPGMNTSVRVKNNRGGQFILAPYKSVVEQMGEYFVFVVGDSSKVSQRKVLLGTRINDKVIIKEGLQEGDKVVAEGVQKLKEGTVISTTPPTPAKP